MTLLVRRFCGQLTRDSYSEIGIAQDGERWSIVLAGPRTGPADTAAAAREILVLTNNARAKARRCGKKTYARASPLSWNQQLADAASRHSEEMATVDYFSHTAKNGSTPGDRVAGEGYRYRVVAENIAAGQSDAHEVIAEWLESPGHCANLMNSEVTEMGAGLHVSPAGAASNLGVYWTEVFAAPR